MAGGKGKTLPTGINPPQTLQRPPQDGRAPPNAVHRSPERAKPLLAPATLRTGGTPGPAAADTARATCEG